MKPLLDAFWRAATYCLRPRVIGLSLLPLVLVVVFSLAFQYFFWDAAVASMATWLDGFALLQRLMAWLESAGMGGLGHLMAPLLVLVLTMPVIVVACLLLVAVLMTPAMVGMVAQRRFPQLELKHGGSLLVSVLWSLGSTLMAVLALIVSMPLWLIPPLVLLLPPLIWGWLTYRVFAFDVLANHASAEERKLLFKRHRSHLLIMGIVTGYMGAAPGLLWASGALMIALAPLLIPVAIWVYTLVFAFASLWFSHYSLSALAELRGQGGAGSLPGSVSDAPVLPSTAPPKTIEPPSSARL